MMKKLHLLATAVFLTAAASTVLVSCTELAPTQETKSENEIVFKTNLNQYYTVKATDTSFEENDEVSIVAMAPIYSNNVKYTFKNGVLTSDNPICWNEGQTAKTEFYILYPYLNYTGAITEESKFEFTIKADQSTHALYTSSDLMADNETASPTDKQVNFEMYHVMSQVVINLTNNSDKQITAAYLSGVYGKIEFDFDDFKTSGSKGTVKACPLSSSAKTQSWALVIAPQDAQPELIFTTSDDKQIKFTLPEEVEFAGAHRRYANVEINESSTVTGFSTEIENWSSDDDLNFHNEGQIEWVYYGKGSYIDDIFASMYGTPHCEMEVDIYYDKADENRIKIPNPYKNWPLAGAGNKYVDGGFQYVEGGALIMYMTDNGGYIVKDSKTGIKTNEFGEILVESVCPENGFEDSCYASETSEDSGCWVAFEVGAAVAYNEQGTQKTVNNFGMTTLTMPGKTRYPVYYSFRDLQYTAAGNIYTLTSIDHTRAGIAWINYGESITSDLLSNIMAGTAAHQITVNSALTSSIENELEGASGFSQTGVYRVVAAGDFTYKDGEYGYGYNYITIPYVAPGDTAPACSPEVVSIAADDNVPTTINLTVKIPNVSRCYLCSVTKAEFDQLQLSESEYYNYAKSNGQSQSGNVASFGGDGQKLQVSGLNPSTEYVILVAGMNMFENTGCTKVTATTGGELSFTSIGTGKFHDEIVSMFFADGGTYEVNVEILQESTGKPIYRVVDPYKELLQNKPSLSDAVYNALKCDYIQFFTHQYTSGNYLFFEPFYCGVSYYGDLSGVGYTTYPLRYNQRAGDIFDDPSQYAATYNNLEIADGVFQIAPTVDIEGSNYIYNFCYESKAVMIALPGKDFPTEASQSTKASLKSSRRKPEPVKND